MANLPLRLAVRGRCGQPSLTGSLGALNRRCMGTHRALTAYSRGVPPRRHRGYTWAVHSEQCSAIGRARVTSIRPGSSARARLTEWVVAGSSAARDGAACAEPAAAADGRCRCAARGARGGADFAAVGAARDGLRGDREAQGASRGCLCVRACMRVRLRACLRARVSAAWAIGEGLQVPRRVHGACQSSVGATRLYEWSDLCGVVTCSSGYRCGPVSDAESWRSSDDGAPPCAQPGLLGCARQGRVRERFAMPVKSPGYDSDR